MGLVGTPTDNRSTVNDNAPSVAVPAGASVGQVYVLIWSNLGSTSTPTWPAGFTELSGAATLESNVLGYTRVATRVCDGTETGSFAGSTSAYQPWEARCLIVGGVQTTVESVNGNPGYAYTSTSSATGASVTSGGAGRYALWVVSTASGGSLTATAALTQPTGFTVRSNIDRGNGTMLAIADNTVGAGAATYSGTVDFGGVADSRGINVVTVIFAPSGPAITANPTDQTANSGGSVTFTAAASGATGGQWQDDSSGSFANITGQTSTSLTVSGVTFAMQGRQYRYAATDGTTTVYTTAALLRVAFQTSGTGPRAVPMLGGAPFAAGPFESLIRSISAGGGGAYFGTMTEAATFTDAGGGVASITLAGADSLTASDAASGSNTTSAAEAESFTALDSPGGVSGTSGASAEFGALTDSAAGLAGFLSASAESATALDLAGASAQFGASSSEALSATDAASSGGASYVVVSEVASAADSPAGVFGALSAAVEAVSAVDGGTGLAAFGAQGAEALSAADAVTASASFQAAGSDTASLADASGAAASFSGAGADALGPSDTASYTGSGLAAASDTLAASEASQGTAAFLSASAESSSVLEASSASAQFVAAGGDTLSAAESAAYLGASASSVGESLTANDAGAALASLSAPAAEALALQEVGGAAASMAGAQADTLSTSDQPAGSRDAQASAVESATLADGAASGGVGQSATVTEAVQAQEASGSFWAALARLADALIPVDLGAVGGALSGLVAEAVSAIDRLTGIVLGAWRGQSTSQQTIPPDAITVQLPAPDDEVTIPPGARTFAVPDRDSSLALPPPTTHVTLDPDMKQNVKPAVKKSSETRFIDVNASRYLGPDETIAAVTSWTVEPVTRVPLVLSTLTVNTTSKVIDGATVPIGQAIRLLAAGGMPGAKDGTPYLARILCTTNQSPEVIELTVPITVNDYPYFS